MKQNSSTASAPRCPQCASPALPIVWGLLYDDPGPEVIIGGCVLPKVPATHGCRECGWQGILGEEAHDDHQL
jgi:hypothetical protein